MAGLPLRPGDSGEAVRDLQLRLSHLGHTVGDDEPGAYGPGTEAAVRAVQADRRLRADGVCGPQTWAAVVEAGYRCGDRLLYLRDPMLRGDDVAQLQSRLGALGFDAGRVDGIFGGRTERALEEFQRNAGLTVDGVCGPATLQMLDRLGERDDRQSVEAVRELERLRSSPRTLQDRRVAVADGGGMHAAVAAVARVLTAAGAAVVVLQHPDQSEQAAEANAAGADVLLGLRLDPDSAGLVTAHYAGHRYESPAGRRLAELVQSVVPDAVGIADAGIRGMAIPLLRETRMPAVVCELGPPADVVPHTADLAAALGRAVAEWAAAPVEVA